MKARKLRKPALSVIAPRERLAGYVGLVTKLGGTQINGAPELEIVAIAAPAMLVSIARDELADLFTLQRHEPVGIVAEDVAVQILAGKISRPATSDIEKR